MLKKRDIYLAHLNYTVRLRQSGQPPEEVKHAISWVISEDKNTCTLYTDLKTRIHPGDLSHELIHVLQFICLDRNINFTLEQEHMGYLMQYLFGQIMGHKWKTPPQL